MTLAQANARIAELEAAASNSKMTIVAKERNVNVSYDAQKHSLILDPYTSGVIEALGITDTLTVRVSKSADASGKQYANLSNESWKAIWSNFVNC